MAYRARIRSLFVLAAFMAVAVSVSLMASATGADPLLLKTIESRVDGRMGVVSIEASDAMSYVASQPEPKTFVVELRDVEARGYDNRFVPDPRSPVSAIDVTSSHALDGSVVTRVRLALAQPIRPRVRSTGNMIVIEADQIGRAVVGEDDRPGGLATAIRDVRITRRENATAVALVGNGRFVTTGVEDTRDAPPRVFIDLPNVTSALPAVTPVGQGPVDQVRIGVNSRSPLVTRVVMDLSRESVYRMEQSLDGRDLTVVFDDVPVAVAAVQIPTQRAVASQEPRMALVQSPPLAVVAPATAQTPGLTPPSAAVATQVVAPRATALAQVPPAPIVVAPQQAPAPQSPVAAQLPPTPAAPGPAATRFTGTPVSLDFQAADLRAVLRTFAEISGLNIVIDPTIQGTVDVALRDVPWDQALDIILRASRLGYVLDGTIMRVAPVTVLADEEAQRRRLAEEQALAGELSVRTIALSYALAQDIQPLLTATVLSARGSIQTDARTNTLIINDLSERLDRAEALVATLDSPQPQVEIEARIVQTTRDFARTLGVQWGFNGSATTALGNTSPLAFPNQGSVGGRTGGTQGDAQVGTAGTAVNLPVGAATSAIGLALGSVNGAFNLDVALSALERQGNGRLLSTPRVSTQNNVEAEITQGVQIPIQTVANNTVTVSFKDAALTLKVTPQITAANTVIMRISVENASPDYSRAVGASQIPPIDTQRAITQVLVSDGDTTVIGGIYVSREQVSQDRTPGLYRLPLLGWLFKRDGISEESRELLIFITPRIIRL